MWKPISHVVCTRQEAKHLPTLKSSWSTTAHPTIVQPCATAMPWKTNALKLYTKTTKAWGLPATRASTPPAATM